MTMFFYVAFIIDVIIIRLLSFSNSVIKFVSKFHGGLLVNVIGILSERFVEFTFYLIWRCQKCTNLFLVSWILVIS